MRLEGAPAQETKVQVGLQLPSEADMDFMAVGPKALLAVEASSESTIKAGALQLTLGAEVHTGRWSVRTGPSASRSDTDWVPIAWATYNNTVPENGWAYLSLRTAPDSHVSRDVQMYAAGFLEG